MFYKITKFFLIENTFLSISTISIGHFFEQLHVINKCGNLT